MNHSIYILSIFLHVIAACMWLGGILFLILAFIPGIKNNPDKINIIANVSLKYRKVGFIALIVLLITGIYQLEYKGVQWSMEYFTTIPFGKAAVLKLIVFAGIILISLIHDYFLGNKTIKAWKEKPDNKETIRLRNASRLMGRISFLLTLIAVFLGVILSRGW